MVNMYKKGNVQKSVYWSVNLKLMKIVRIIRSDLTLESDEN